MQQELNKKRARRLFAATVTLYFSITIILSMVLGSKSKIGDLIIWILFLMPIICAFIASMIASKSSSSHKRLWQLMSIGMFLWLAGAVTIMAYIILLGPAKIPSPSLADIFGLAYVPMVAGVMFSLGRIRPPFDNEKKQFLTSVAMLALAAFLVCFKFVLVPALSLGHNLSGLGKLFAIVYPLMDWIIFVSLLASSRRFKNDQINGWHILLMTAFGIAVFADFLSYLTGSILSSISSICMAAAAISIVAAAIDAKYELFIGTINSANIRNSLHISPGDSTFKTLLVPAISTLLIAAVWATWLSNGYKSETPILILGSTSIMLLLVYRTHLLISDNAVLHAKSMGDNLTGLNNYRYFQEALTKAVLKANKAKKDVSLITINIDNFSQINAVYGHTTGDKALVTIGNTITASLRETDEACRLNGDEFAVILPKTDSDSAYVISNKLNSSIKSAIHEQLKSIEVTVSIGISTFPTLANDKNELLQTADGALYWAKSNGKNNIMLYDPEVVKALNAEERATKVEESALTDMVRGLAQAVDARDSYTCTHSSGVSSVATSLSKYIGLDDKTIKRIEVAGTLHDIGKIGIPDNILNKPGRLSGDEVKVIMNHPELSAQILQSTSLKEIIPAVKAHHERWDGNGYPDGLKEHEIPIEARILAIADTFDAMTTSRPYRAALPVEEALGEIQRCSGSQFDPYLAQQFLQMFGYNDKYIDLSDLEMDMESDDDDLEQAVNF